MGRPVVEEVCESTYTRKAGGLFLVNSHLTTEMESAGKVMLAGVIPAPKVMVLMFVGSLFSIVVVKPSSSFCRAVRAVAPSSPIPRLVRY